jgi:hypothetical protein
MDTGRAVVDADWEIISEYRHKIRESGEPGIGDAFLKWILTNQTNPERCRFVDTRMAAIPTSLADFDASDIKFIRTAVAAPEASIAQAADSLWWKRRQDFADVDVAVNFLCPGEISELSDRKHGKS